MNFSQVGRRIRAVRKARKLTQAELAEAADLSVTYISHIERGTKKVSLTALVQIAGGLGVTLDYLLSGSQPADQTAYFREVQELLADSPQWERQILCDVAAALKQSLRRNGKTA